VRTRFGGRTDGRTLYYFALDIPAAGQRAPVSHCTGGCLPIWPIFHVDTPVVGTGLNASNFGEFVRADGAKQTTFKGWPLYFFAGDAKAGDTNAVADVFDTVEPRTL
jgi:predicted lipoprotein with Yx(FWY)xxD motif